MSIESAESAMERLYGWLERLEETGLNLETDTLLVGSSALALHGVIIGDGPRDLDIHISPDLDWSPSEDMSWYDKAIGCAEFIPDEEDIEIINGYRSLSLMGLKKFYLFHHEHARNETVAKKMKARADLVSSFI